MIKIIKSARMTVVLLGISVLLMISACGLNSSSSGGDSSGDNSKILVILYPNFDNSSIIPLHVRRGIILSNVLQSNVEREGYTFKYWTSDEEGIGVQYLPDTHLWFHTNLYAQWEPVSFAMDEVSYISKDYQVQHIVKAHLAEDNYLCFIAFSGILVKEHVMHYMGNHKGINPPLDLSNYNIGYNTDSNIDDNVNYEEGYGYCKGSFVIQDTVSVKSNAVEQDESEYLLLEELLYLEKLKWSTEPNGEGVIIDEQYILNNDLMLYPMVTN